MDKLEYSSRLEEIKKLLRQGKRDEALDLLDGINWRKVHNVNVLLKASELYEAAGAFEEARELLEVAHERSPIGRMIIYRLALISIELKAIDEAREYYEEFVEIAPHDSLKYIIKYKLNEAKGSDDQTLIAILEELRSHDLIEEWLFELACLYRKTAQVEKCIEICDEIALWFGEGPYVEKALEMKMLYHPLDKQQEDKYRHFQQKRDGLTEIRPEEVAYGNGEILNRAITIPQVELKPERFNTVNLQAEIKKNIEEIMQATEAGEISENMEIIKNLVEEIPYLQVTEKLPVEELPSEEEAPEEAPQSLNSKFQEYLAEEYDGQMSLFMPTQNVAEREIQGQLSIQDVMDNWEKTRRAAEAALQDAEQKKLEREKAKALYEVNQIMDRLVEAIPKLDAGVAPEELLKEEYLSKETVTEEEQALAEQKTFPIPTIEGGVGIEIPIISASEIAGMTAEAPIHATEVVAKATEAAEEATDWEPSELEDDKASQIISDINLMMQQEIDRMVAEEEQQNASPEVEDTQELEPEGEAVVEEDPVGDLHIGDDPEEILAEEVVAEQEAAKPDLSMTGEIRLDEDENPEDSALAVIIAEEIREELSAEGITDEDAGVYRKELNDEERDVFAYFTPIEGMEASLARVIDATKVHLTNDVGSTTGNIIIQGGKGSGKSTLSTEIVRLLQREIRLPAGNVGKIDGAKLNEKNIVDLFQKIQGGCLMIENAGNLERETVLNLSLIMDSDKTGILVILEDSRMGIDRVMSYNPNFTQKFTQRIEIPILSIDELVSFGKTYAADLGYMIDEMGVLALYNEINLIQRLDHPTYLTEVKEIVDSAINNASAGGFKGMIGRLGIKRYDESGNIILHEKDFQSQY
ncbi:MAG: tetratricopeptide repeat protein [Lachnospiraceae bacterium]|nr:tetratricopeptide repeat protein [Lachnospiraceae bacterium]